MRLFRMLKTFLILLGLIEIAGFIIVGKLIGVWFILLWIVLTTVLGIAVVRYLGFTIAYQTMQRIHRGGLPPEQDMIQGWLMFAGFLLILPGFLTDLIGLILLLPTLRQFLSRKFRMRGSRFRSTTVEWYEEVKGHERPMPDETARENPSRIIEGEFEHKEDGKEK